MITVCGEPKTLTDLRNIEVIRPERAGPRWMGIPHYDLAVAIEDSLYDRGIEILSEKWSTDKSGQSLVGGINVRFPERLGISQMQGMEFSLGVRHTNDLRHALTFAVGTQILVCHNGMISGEFVLCRKHTQGLNLGDEVSGGIDRFINEAKQVEGCVVDLKARELSRQDSDHMLMEAGRKRLLPWSHIGKVEKEYQNPRFSDFSEKTSWGLYNAFTYVAQKSNPARQLHALGKFRHIVQN